MLIYPDPTFYVPTDPRNLVTDIEVITNEGLGAVSALRINPEEYDHRNNNGDDLTPLVITDAIPISIHGNEIYDRVYMNPTPPNPSTMSPKIYTKSYHTKREVKTPPHIETTIQQQATDSTGVNGRQHQNKKQHQVKVVQ